MELLRINQELISYHIRALETAEDLKIHNYINEYDLYEIRNQNDNQSSFKKLLQILEDNNSVQGILKLHEIIRHTYPMLNAIIPGIQTGLRFKRFIGDYKIVKISLFNKELAVDIRKFKV